LVSTVGEVKDDILILGHIYETLVFRAGERCVDPDCFCLIPAHDGSSIDCERYDKRGEAAKGHIAMCEKYAEKARGETA
jgi:hypothetical protein